MLKSSPRAERSSVYSHGHSTPIWWAGIVNKVSRAKNLYVWQVAPAESQALAKLTQRSMQLQVTVQDGTAWIGNGVDSFEVTPVALMPKAE